MGAAGVGAAATAAAGTDSKIGLKFFKYKNIIILNILYKILIVNL